MRRIAIEEHFITKEYMEYLFTRRDCPRWEIVEGGKDRRVERRWTDPSLSPSVYDPDTPGQSSAFQNCIQSALSSVRFDSQAYGQMRSAFSMEVVR